MGDVFSREKRSEVMRGIRSKDTRPEMFVRRALHKAGYRYRLHRGDLPGKPDIVLPRLRVIVQVRGCFWHGHGCWLAHEPGSRRGYWLPKIEGNRARDRRNDRMLRKMGWAVLVVWECKCRRIGSSERAIARLLAALSEAEGG
jgi:DNA mismatch endonuclease (patch repair protein)